MSTSIASLRALEAKVRGLAEQCERIRSAETQVSSREYLKMEREINQVLGNKVEDEKHETFEATLDEPSLIQDVNENLSLLAEWTGRSKLHLKLAYRSSRDGSDLH